MALAVLATLGTAWAAVGGGDRPVRTAAVDRPALTDDDGDAPLFRVAAVGPGDVLQRCIRLTYGGEGAATVALSGRVRGALADDVTLTVERGSGGGYDGCAGFRGAQVYRGTLGGFTAFEDAAPWRADRRDHATFRFTVTGPPSLSPAAQRASADFSWEWRPSDARPEDDRKDDRSPDRTPVVAQAHPPAAGRAGADGSPGADREAGARERGAREGTRARGARGTGMDGRPTRPDGARGDAAGDAARGRGDKPSLGERIGRFVEQAGRVAAEGAKRAAFPAILLFALGLFLVAQDRIDRRDPKLALAPVHRDHDLPFEPYDPRGPRP